jgi:glyoxylase-like metal-dependent hydrolase (beta-lactamase superfamily II)
MTITAPLTWEVFVAPAELTVTDDLPPGAQHRAWSPISATLLVGEHDAVLVDPLMTTTQAQVLAGWVAATGKNLATVYVTHGHGDHFFGLGVLLDHFPGARAIAAPAVVERMRQSMTAESVALWARRFPGQIPTRLVIAEALTDGGFELEGHELVAVDLGHTDTDDTTCLHVPDIGLVVAGDAVYNDVHLYLAESGPTAHASGSPPLTPSKPSSPEPSSPGTSAPSGMTAQRRSRRPAATSATSTASRRPPRPHTSSTRRCWPSIPTE